MAELGDPAAGAEDWRPLVQIVRFQRHPFQAADVELAVLMRTPAGFCLRRVSLAGSDLPRALPYLLDADPEALGLGGRSAAPVRVVDVGYDRADEAVAAAHEQPPTADPEDWVDGTEFCSSVMDDPDLAEALRPWAYRVGDLGVVVGVLAGMGVFAAVLYASYLLNVSVGLDTPERKDSLQDNLFGIAAFLVSGVLAVLAYTLSVRLLDGFDARLASKDSGLPGGRHRA